MQKVKAFVVLSDSAPGRDRVIPALEAHCRKYLAAFERPRVYEFIAALPRTKLGKVAYSQLTVNS
jgi:long-chain acyl-CoA synthetase